MNQGDGTTGVRNRLLDCVQVFAQFEIFRLSLFGILRKAGEVRIDVFAVERVEEDYRMHRLQNEIQHLIGEAENVGHTEAWFDAELQQVIVDALRLGFCFR